LVNLAHAFIDSFSPNSKIIDGPNVGNYTLWAQGFMGRYSGLFGSCPLTNAKIFGFDGKDLKEGNIESILGKLGFLYDISSLSFPDPEIISPIENQIFDSREEFQFIRTGSEEPVD
jgi:hypothetical protein